MLLASDPSSNGSGDYADRNDVPDGSDLVQDRPVPRRLGLNCELVLLI